MELKELARLYVAERDLTMAPAGKKTITYRLNLWRKVGGPMDAEAITKQVVVAFRTSAVSLGYSYRSIEDCISVVMRLLKEAGITPPPLGHRLPKPHPDPMPPSADAINRFLENVGEHTYWPRHGCRWLSCDREAWWRAYIFLSVWTGLRRGDVFRLDWRNVNFEREYFEIRPSKTRHHGKAPIRYPLTPIVLRYLEMLGPRERGPMLGASMTCQRQLLREMANVSEAADVPYIYPQSLRQYSVTMWSSANATAGQIIHGSYSLEVLRHYVDKLELLRATAANLRLPEGLLTASEVTQHERERIELLAAFDSADPGTRRMILELAAKVS